MQNVMNEFDKIDLQSAYTLLREIYTLRVSVLSALALANLTAIGYAIGRRKSAIFIVGCVICGAALTAEYSINKLYFPTVLRGLVLTRRYSGDSESLFSAIVAGSQKQVLFTISDELYEIEDPQVSRRKLAAATQNIGRLIPKRDFIVIGAWSVALLLQLLAVPILRRSPRWKFV